MSNIAIRKRTAFAGMTHEPPVETIAGSWLQKMRLASSRWLREIWSSFRRRDRYYFSDDNGWLMPVCSDGLSPILYLDDGHPAMEARPVRYCGYAVDKVGMSTWGQGQQSLRKIDGKTG